MKRVIYILAILVLAACIREQDAARDTLQPEKTVTQTHEFQIPLEIAIDNLWSLVDHMEGTPQTRTGQNRGITEVNFITIDREATRSTSDFVIPDTLLYVVKFNDGRDYAILSADTRVPSVIGITGTKIIDRIPGYEPPKFRPNPPTITLPDNYMQTLDDGEDICYDEPDDEIDTDNADINANPVETEEELFQFITDFSTSYALEEILKTYARAATRADIPDWNWDGKTWVTTERVPPCCMTTWHQNAPYNDCISKHLLTPGAYTRGTRYKAGCVAIALSQITTANEFPKKINNVTLPWDAIRNVGSYYSGKENKGTPLEQSWASWLVAVVGIDAKTDYGTKSSGSTWKKALKVLERYKYRNVKKYEMSENIYGATKNMIRNGKPVYYSGRTQRLFGSGHAWVVDGLWHIYNKANPKEKMELRHVNFGWREGLHNGWYRDGVFHPSINMVAYDSEYGDYYNYKKRQEGYKRYIKILRYDLP